jgi:hypothetical protein
VTLAKSDATITSFNIFTETNKQTKTTGVQKAKLELLGV